MIKKTFLFVSLILFLAFSVYFGFDAQAQRGGGPGGFGGPGIEASLNAEFDQVDVNQDGKLSKEEVSNWLWNRVARRDTDNDQSLSRQEVAAAGQPMRGMPGRGSGGVDFESNPLAKNDAEKKVLDELNELIAGPRLQNVPPLDGRLLRLLAEARGAQLIVEIGTSNGQSSLWMSLGLLQTGGKITTFEIDPQRAAMARENFKKAGVDSIVTIVEGDAHEKVSGLKDPIDLLFIDADKEGYLDYFNKLLPLVQPGGLVVAHNIDARMADPNYVKAITTNPNLETLFMNMGSGGISVTLKKR